MTSSSEFIHQDLPMYGENATWMCRNKHTQFRVKINGALAEILKKYPNDYALKLLHIREASPNVN